MVASWHRFRRLLLAAACVIQLGLAWVWAALAVVEALALTAQPVGAASWALTLRESLEQAPSLL